MSGSLVPHDPGRSNLPVHEPTQPWLEPAPAAEEEAGLPVARYLAALKRFRWLMVAVVLAGIGLGVAATRFIKPSYQARSTIWISEGTNDKTGPIRANELLEQSAWTELFMSFAIVDAVVNRERLYLTPTNPADSTLFANFQIGERVLPGLYLLTPQKDGATYTLTRRKEGQEVEHGVLGDSIGRALGFRWAPDASLLRDRRAIEFTVLSPRDASIALLGRLDVTLPRGSNFLRLALVDEDPHRASITLNAWTREFVAAAADLKKRNTVEFSKILQGQLAYAERRLKDAEFALQSFRVNTITLPSEGTAVAPGIEMTRDPVYTNFFAQKVQYDNVKRDREALQALLADAGKDSFQPEQLFSIPGLLEGPGAEALRGAITDLHVKQSQLRTLRQTYTEEYGPVRDLERQVRTAQGTTIPQLARGILQQLQTRETDLGSRISSASHEMRDIPTRTIEEMRRKRDYDAAASLYTSLANRFEEAKLAEASAVPDVSILDSAVTPLQPTNNTAPKLIALAVAVSLVLAIGLAILLDLLDPRFRYATQASELGLPIIGVVPTIRRGRGTAVDLEEAAQVVESFRSIRLNIRHAFDAGGPILFTVTSPGVHDGKSLIASNLALAFAEGGYRTLLVDGDTRRGEQHAMFSVDQRPGLLDYLAGAAGIDEVLRATSHEKLSLIPCGARRHRGPELIASPLMSTLLGEMVGRVDVMIVDSPPLSAGIDPFALGTATSNMLLVLRAGATDRKLAQAKLKVLRRLPIRMLGAVLNDVRTSEGEYRYYSYDYAYSTTEESVPQLTSQVGEIH